MLNKGDLVKQSYKNVNDHVRQAKWSYKKIETKIKDCVKEIVWEAKWWYERIDDHVKG